jgi:hypothetical protein
MGKRGYHPAEPQGTYQLSCLRIPSALHPTSGPLHLQCPGQMVLPSLHEAVPCLPSGLGLAQGHLRRVTHDHPAKQCSPSQSLVGRWHTCRSLEQLLPSLCIPGPLPPTTRLSRPCGLLHTVPSTGDVPGPWWALRRCIKWTSKHFFPGSSLGTAES